MVWIIGDHVRKLYIKRVKLTFLVALSPFSAIRTEGWFVLALVNRHEEQPRRLRAHR
ncbi:hypothetical protein MCOR03_002681 [Pyricularia oryzae]|nr:hypothetical protein MCOR19_008583 [Pyricularia oryzae]KAI6358252.1 hypothetical protein MCOR31_009951 [Pyricularia oryzae]KAI6373530.1 hypothetical protein MCOR32_005696 [Pyricularia oryzae]KAI6394795.1 hypothetical protein MCOR24_009465 [Pyricularia oryzae]KAI6394876.1 hypothetical protein MCOR23_007310 [Pyricularia oryzae]